MTRRSRPKRIGNYSIVGQLGSGGMSRVYRAIADGTKTEVALKATPLDNDIDVTVEDYELEVIIGQRLQHPHAVSAIDDGCHDGYIYLAMPIVEGATLSNATRLRDPSRKPSSRRSRAWNDAWVVPMLERQWAQIALIGLQISGALAACHAAGVIHRDIKPGNIMMDRNGDTYLADFGLAWMRNGPTEQKLATKAGTARYLPPEVFEEQRDERSDIYSLGVTLHELATGLKIWGDIDHETMREERPSLRVPHIRNIREGVPQVLADCIDKASADDPEERHQTAADLEEHFRIVLDRLLPVACDVIEDCSAWTGTWPTDAVPVLTEEVWFS